jgi:RHS repeat-associated protein
VHLVTLAQMIFCAPTVALALPVRAKDLRAERSDEHHIISLYDFRNRLTEVTQGGTVIATYTYNALDQRIGIQESGGRTWTVYNGTSADALPYADFNGSGTLLTRYVFGPGMVNGAVVDELLARTSSGGTTAWYLTDKLDSVRDVVSSSGTVLDHVVYDSFGNILTETNASNGDRFKFAGMEFDTTTGQDYDRARYYSSPDGRFSRVDPLGFTTGNANLYAYVTGDPANLTDRTGLLTESGESGEQQDQGERQPGNPALQRMLQAIDANERALVAAAEQMAAQEKVADKRLLGEDVQFLQDSSEFVSQYRKQLAILRVMIIQNNTDHKFWQASIDKLTAQTIGLGDRVRTQILDLHDEFDDQEDFYGIYAIDTEAYQLTMDRLREAEAHMQTAIQSVMWLNYYKQEIQFAEDFPIDVV